MVPSGSIASNAAIEMEMRIIAPDLGPTRVDANRQEADSRRTAH
jgi:hypothetical protein